MRHCHLAILVIPLFTGCSVMQHTLLDGGAAAGGALIGNQLSHGNPLATAGGALGGVVLSETGQALVSHNRDKAFNDGYRKGQSDAVKSYYWSLQDQQRQGPQVP
jgi:hypothetical protein